MNSSPHDGSGTGTPRPAVDLRDARALPEAELEPLLALNNAHATELSHLAPGRFRELLNAAWLALTASDGNALLLAFDQDADYDGANFLWFRERWPRFAYVDRVVTAPEARGRGVARALYKATLARAAEDGLERVCCEVNLEPPNPGSDAFHVALGFVEVGRAVVPGSGRVVRYLAREAF